MKLHVKNIVELFGNLNSKCISRTLSNIINCIDSDDPLYNYKLSLLIKYSYTHIGGWRAAEIHQQVDQFKRAGEMCDVITGFLSPDDINGRSVMDYGCAEGSILWSIHKQYKPKRLIGIDSNIESIRICNLTMKLNKCNNIKFIHDDYTKCTIPAHTALCIEPDPGPPPAGINDHTVMYFGGEHDDIKPSSTTMSFKDYIAHRFSNRNVSVAGVLPGQGQDVVYNTSKLQHKNYYLMRVCKRISS